MKKEVEVIDMNGAKTVKKKQSVITWAKRIFLIVSILWLSFVAYAPIYVKNHYEGPIKKSIVVSIFFDLQRNIAEQYEKLLDGVKKSINLEKPIGIAIDKVKMADSAVNKVANTTAAAKTTTANAKSILGIAGKLGVKTGGVDNAIAKVDNTVTQVDNTAKLVNAQLDKIQKDLVKISQTEVDKMIDEAIKSQIDKNSGGLGTTLLTNYGIRHVYPWRPSSWPVAVKIYNDLEKSNVGVLNIITNTVNTYFGYVAWGLVVAAWIAGLFVWSVMLKYYKGIIAPFIVCPRCGYTFADKRTALGLLKVFKPWSWFGI